MSDIERRRSESFISIVNKYWPMIVSTALVIWVGFNRVQADSVTTDKRLTIVERAVSELTETVKEVRMEVKGMRDEQREGLLNLLRATRNR